ncbi:MAG: hypothetical protein CVV63_03170, partial [Tenericutes bacterium HGW-Tenericutes-8]
MKKLLLLALLCLLTPLQIKAAGLDYQVITETESILEGITFQNISAHVYNDSGTQSIQNISVIEGSDTLSLTTWSFFGPDGSLVNKDVRALARDFELNNPGYEVIAGVNGDYFQTGQTINANMIFGSRLVKSINHDKYFAIELDRNGHLVDTHKKLTLGQYKAYIYDKDTHALLKVVTLETFNDSTIEDNQTGLFYNYDSINKANGIHYSFDIQMKTVTDNNFFFLLDNPEQRNQPVETTSTKVAMLSKDDAVNQLLSLGAYVKVQKEIKDVSAASTLLGVDSMIIEDGNIKAFTEIGGQSTSNNESRHPRTGIGFDQFNQPVLMTIDGRQTGFSNGVNLREFAYIMKEKGIVTGFNLDGGGSTQAIIKDGDDFRLLNSPSEGGPLNHRAVSNAVFFIRPIAKANITTTLENDELTIHLPSLAYNIYINGNKYTPTGLTETFLMDSKVDHAISITTNTLSSTSVFEDVIYAYYVKETILPTFSIEHNHINPLFELKVAFEDPDRLIDRMYVVHEETDIQKVALIQYAGLRKATFDEIQEGANHFTIYYELSNGLK